VMLAVGDVREVPHRRDDPAGDERVVVVERGASGGAGRANQAAVSAVRAGFVNIGGDREVRAR
jgi:hypothetical protein